MQRHCSCRQYLVVFVLHVKHEPPSPSKRCVYFGSEGAGDSEVLVSLVTEPGEFYLTSVCSAYYKPQQKVYTNLNCAWDLEEVKP